MNAAHDPFGLARDALPASVGELRAAIRYEVAVRELHATALELVESDRPALAALGAKLLRHLSDASVSLDDALGTRPPRGKHRLVIPHEDTRETGEYVARQCQRDKVKAA